MLADFLRAVKVMLPNSLHDDYDGGDGDGDSDGSGDGDGRHMLVRKYLV